MSQEEVCNFRQSLFGLFVRQKMFWNFTVFEIRRILLHLNTGIWFHYERAVYFIGQLYYIFYAELLLVHSMFLFQLK